MPDEPEHFRSKFEAEFVHQMRTAPHIIPPYEEWPRKMADETRSKIARSSRETSGRDARLSSTASNLVRSWLPSWWFAQRKARQTDSANPSKGGDDA